MLSACKKDQPYVATLQDHPVRFWTYYFYFNDSFYTWQGTSTIPGPSVSHLVMSDSIQKHYSKLQLLENAFIPDSVWFANDVPGLSQGRGADYVLCVKNRECKFDIYFPYKLQGSYVATLTEDESYLLYALLQDVIDDVEYKDSHMIDTIDYDVMNPKADIYFETFSSEASTQYLKLYPNSENNADVLDLYLMILLRSKIPNATILDSMPQLNRIRDQYNALFYGGPILYDKKMIDVPPPLPQTFDNPEDTLLDEIDSL
jgi:hypothetical protein